MEILQYCTKPSIRSKSSYRTCKENTNHTSWTTILCSMLYSTMPKRSIVKTSWWHKMEMLSALLAICEGNPLLTSGLLSQRASNADLWCFLFRMPEQCVAQTVELLVIWDAMMLIWHPCNVIRCHVILWQDVLLDIEEVQGYLTYWGQDKMANIFQMTFSNTFSWMNTFELLLRFHWILFLRVELTIFQHCGSDDGLALTRWQAIIWTNDGLIYWRICASLGLSELTLLSNSHNHDIRQNGGVDPLGAGSIAQNGSVNMDCGSSIIYYRSLKTNTPVTSS